MGLRVRLKASFDIRPFPRQARIVLDGAEALRDDGRRQRLELVHHAARPSPGWSNDQLHTLGQVKGSNFEVVDTSKLRP